MTLIVQCSALYVYKTNDMCMFKRELQDLKDSR